MSGGERGTPGPLLPHSLHQAGAAFYLGVGKKGRAKEERNEDTVPAPARWQHATERPAGSCAALGVSPLGAPHPQLCDASPSPFPCSLQEDLAEQRSSDIIPRKRESSDV